MILSVGPVNIGITSSKLFFLSILSSFVSIHITAAKAESHATFAVLLSAALLREWESGSSLTGKQLNVLQLLFKKILSFVLITK